MDIVKEKGEFKMFDEMDKYLKEIEEMDIILWEEETFIPKKIIKKFTDSFKDVEVPVLPF